MAVISSMDQFMKKMGKCLTGLSAVAIFTSLLDADRLRRNSRLRVLHRNASRQPTAPQAPAAQPAPAAHALGGTQRAYHRDL